MFKPKTIKAFSVVAIVLSIIGFLLSILLVVKMGGLSFLGLISWAILLWASYIGYRLSSYKLYEDEYKKVGIRIYLVIAAFVLFFFVGFTIGIVLSVILLVSLWALKSNYDDWDNSDTLFDEPAPPDPKKFS